jgi:hypothetical protein
MRCCSRDAAAGATAPAGPTTWRQSCSLVCVCLACLAGWSGMMFTTAVHACSCNAQVMHSQCSLLLATPRGIKTHPWSCLSKSSFHHVYAGTRVTEKCDIYALGCILCEAISGQVPWSELYSPAGVAAAPRQSAPNKGLSQGRGKAAGSANLQCGPAARGSGGASVAGRQVAPAAGDGATQHRHEQRGDASATLPANQSATGLQHAPSGRASAPLEDQS